MNPEIPRITSPDKQYPSIVSGTYLDYQYTEEDGTVVTHSHYWRRIYATAIPCGQNIALTFGAKVGVSQSVLEEAAESLEVTLKVLKVTLADKRSVTNVLTREETVQLVRNVAPAECNAVTFAEWQKWERTEVSRPKTFLWFRTGRRKTAKVDIGIQESYSDHFEYPKPDCCPKAFKESLLKGFLDVFTISFPSKTVAVLARETGDGQIELRGLPGAFTPGEILDLHRFAELFGLSGMAESATVGTLSRQSLGTVSEFFGLSSEEKHSAAPNPLPWIIASACGALIAWLIRRDTDTQSSADRSGTSSAQNEEGLEIIERVYREPPPRILHVPAPIEQQGEYFTNQY
jgi:hypothetical protein